MRVPVIVVMVTEASFSEPPEAIAGGAGLLLVVALGRATQHVHCVRTLGIQSWIWVLDLLLLFQVWMQLPPDLSRDEGGLQGSRGEVGVPLEELGGAVAEAEADDEEEEPQAHGGHGEVLEATGEESDDGTMMVYY